jgi:adenosylcobinamide-GDP ribazoletransferase
MRLIFVAFQFLTIIPLPFRVNWQDGDMGRSMSLFPLIGLIIGGGLAGLYQLLSLVLPLSVTMLLLIVALSLVTGALHLDGLADVCDGIAARGGRERFLAVMKDSRVGAVGVVGLVLGLLLKYQALLAIPSAISWQGIVFFPAVARFSQVLMAVGSRRARVDGLGAACIDGAGLRELLLAALSIVLFGQQLLGPIGILCICMVTGFTLLAKWWFHRALGGITGDVIGCVSELNEILCLLTLVVLYK